MSTTTDTAAATAVRTVRRDGVLGAVGGALTAVCGLTVTAIVQPVTTVTPDRWSYPWTPGILVPVSVLYCVLHLLVLAGLLGFLRSGVAGPGRAGRIGGTVAAVGTGALAVAELVTLVAADLAVDDPVTGMVGALFGIGNLVAAMGLLLAGVATVRARAWSGWRRWTPLATGLVLTAALPLAPTPALPAAVAVYGLAVLAFGTALATRPVPDAAAPRDTRIAI